jgi:hypothetical protein
MFFEQSLDFDKLVEHCSELLVMKFSIITERIPNSLTLELLTFLGGEHRYPEKPFSLADCRV